MMSWRTSKLFLRWPFDVDEITGSANKSATVSASKSATVSASKRPETQLPKGSAKADTLTVMKNDEGHQISI